MPNTTDMFRAHAEWLLANIPLAELQALVKSSHNRGFIPPLRWETTAHIKMQHQRDTIQMQMQDMSGKPIITTYQTDTELGRGNWLRENVPTYSSPVCLRKDCDGGALGIGVLTYGPITTGLKAKG